MKSHVRALTVLAICVYQDAMAKCAAQPHERDIKTLKSRVEHEGVNFLTITLPNLGQELERALDQGVVAPAAFRAFKKPTRRSKTPAFLQGFFELVFDSGTGRILDEPSVAAIEGLRQMAYTFKKLRLDCTPTRVRSALQEFVSCEQSLAEPILQADLDYFRQVSSLMWGVVLAGSELNELSSMIPRHGPGATAERVTGNRKYEFSRWHDRLEPYFPMLHWAFSTEEAYDSPEFQKVTVISEDDEQPVRVVTVPKTLKTPRIIAIEPVCMQYTQQALSRALIDTLERHPLTSGHINFRDQQVNRRLANDSSRTQRLATVDLSSASDRVSAALVYDMLGSVPDFRDAAFACRSRRAQLPDGQILDLRKFASMGSALCFPIESMYFYTICVGALLVRHNLPVTFRNIIKVSRDVYVYGDDILVPADSAAAVCDHLQKYYCKVNTRKSFWTGKFRESCGLDAYDGEEVTPTYLRYTCPTDRRTSAHEIISWCKTSNLFYRRGYWKTADHMMKTVEGLLGPLPLVEETCAGLGKVSFQHTADFPRFKLTRKSKRYQVDEVLTWRPSPVRQPDKIGGYNALLKSLLLLESSEEELASDADHLERSVRYGTVTLKRRWTRPY